MNIELAHPLLIGIFVFVGVACSLIGLGAVAGTRARMIEARVRALGSRTPRNGTAQAGTAAAKRPEQRAFWFGGAEKKHSLRARLLEAGIYEPRAIRIYLALQFSSAVMFPLAFLLSAYLGHVAWLYAIISAVPGAALGMYLPHVWLEHRRSRRHVILRRSLPDFLDLIVACVAGGLSIQAALAQVTEELRLAHPELSGELGITLREIELGASLDHALQQLATRTGLEELRTLRSFVQQTTKFGTTITNALEQMAEMLRSQRAQRAEELAQKAVVKILFPTLLFIFPTVFVVVAGPAAIQIKEGVAASTRHSTAPVTEN